ncbi:hypothetical protein [Variovorax paradoxus]|uniref:hypothetical protein n=1 Tax=Variovorax paradoxus TaxID=34073 RepID=UPI0004035B4C|nr:hypothetical protein [Variovorax paradoxus]
MNIHRFSRNAVLCGLVLAQTAGHAAQYPLAQAPRNTAVKEPAPNVIVSVDNSGSMAWSSRASEGKDPSAGTPTRLEALKTALRDNFSAANISNDRIRLSWQAMNNNKNGKNGNCVGFFGDSAAGTYQAGRCLVNGRANANLMRSLDDTHRANFMSWVDALAAEGGTPLHAMMTRAGEYMKTTGQFNPYSDDPGVEGATQSSCRKSFHIFMTDGDYNLFGFKPEPAALGMPAIGNADGASRALPDAVAYVPRAPYKDDAGAANNSWEKDASGWWPKAEYWPTLADMAFHYWASDLQPAVSNNLKKVVAEPGDVTVGTATVPEYWNPRNDPATWQHLNTYTIGFGAASSWTGVPAVSADASQPTYSGDYARLVDGSIALEGSAGEHLGGNGEMAFRKRRLRLLPRAHRQRLRRSHGPLARRAQQPRHLHAGRERAGARRCLPIHPLADPFQHQHPADLDLGQRLQGVERHLGLPGWLRHGRLVGQGDRHAVRQ